MQVEILSDNLPNYKKGDKPHLKPHVAETMCEMGVARMIDLGPRVKEPGENLGPGSVSPPFFPTPQWSVTELAGQPRICWQYCSEIRYYGGPGVLPPASMFCPQHILDKYKELLARPDKVLLANEAERHKQFPNEGSHTGLDPNRDYYGIGPYTMLHDPTEVPKTQPR